VIDPLISILIPNYNRADIISDTLESVLAQTYTHWECIIVDDGSTDNSEDIIQTFVNKDKRFQYQQRPENRPKGGNACRNYALEISKGTLINWLDSDDLLLENHLALHVKTHLENSNKSMVVTDANVFEGDARKITRKWSKITPDKDIIIEMCQAVVLWPINCVSWKRDSLKTIRFNENLSSSQEWTFHLMQLIHTKDRESVLLKSMLSSLRDAIKFKYGITFSIMSNLWKNLSFFSFKVKIIRVLLFYAPFYFITGKGDKLFHI